MTHWLVVEMKSTMVTENNLFEPDFDLRCVDLESGGVTMVILGDSSLKYKKASQNAAVQLIKDKASLVNPRNKLIISDNKITEIIPISI